MCTRTKDKESISAMFTRDYNLVSSAMGKEGEREDGGGYCRLMDDETICDFRRCNCARPPKLSRHEMM